jgi:hypothetical protein
VQYVVASSSREDVCLSYDTAVIHSLNAAAVLPTCVAGRKETVVVSLGSIFAYFQQKKKTEP